MILLAYSHMLFPHPIAFPEYSHAFLPKCSQSIPIAFPQRPQKNSHGIPIVLPWYSLGAPRPFPSYRGVFPQYSCSVSTVCPLYSYDVPLIFPCGIALTLLFPLGGKGGRGSDGYQ